MDVLSLAEELAEEFASRAAEIDREGRFPFENIERMKETGYLKICIPEDCGGFGADLATTAKAQGIIGGACPSTALSTNMHIFGLGAAAEGYSKGEPGTAMTKPLFDMVSSGMIVGGSITDAATGLNVKTSSTPARKVDGGWIVSGRKSFCSLAPVLDFFWGTASEEGKGGLLLFGLLRDTPGLEFVDSWDTMSMRGTGSWDVIFNDVFVPDAAMQGNRPGTGDVPTPAWGPMTERPFAWFVFTVASIYLAAARSATTFAYDYVNKRKPGTELPASRQPGNIFNAGEIELLLRPAEAMVRDGLARRAAGETLSAAQLGAIKHTAVNNADAAVDRCLRMVGGHGLFRKLPIERIYRDVRAGQFHPPSNDVALETIGRAALGIPADAEPRWPTD